MSNEAQYKHCRDCCAKLPLTAFGVYKYADDGLRPICKECKNQSSKLDRKKKYNLNNLPADVIIRHVKTHNTEIIQQALSIPILDCIGFVPHTDQLFHIQFNRSQHGVFGCILKNQSKELISQVVYPNMDERIIIEQLLNIFKGWHIRLELSDMHMLASKNTIYWY